MYFIFKVEGKIVCFLNFVQDLIVYVFVFEYCRIDILMVYQCGGWCWLDVFVCIGGGMVWVGVDLRVVVNGRVCVFEVEKNLRVCIDILFFLEKVDIFGFIVKCLLY